MSALMAVTLSITAFAASGAFVGSPSATQAPELVEYKSDSNSAAKLNIGSYADRDSMPEAAKAKLEEAYNQIVNASSDNAFSKMLNDFAKDKKIDAKDLAVSDLFDISCSEDGDQGTFKVKIKIDSIDKFVGIAHFSGEKWDLVEIVESDKESGYVTFKAGEFSPFAVLVSNGEMPSDGAPAFVLPLVISVVVVAALAVVVIILIKSKKKK